MFPPRLARFQTARPIGLKQKARPLRGHRTRLRLEALEERTLLSVVPAGSEFLVNTYTTLSQAGAAVAMDADGDFVVAWQSQQDGDIRGIYAQRYNAAGVPQGGEFRVNTYTTDSQQDPSVAMDADGDFVVAWESVGQDGSGYGIYAQRYNAAGVAQGSEFRVNTYTTSEQKDPSVAMEANGDFVVAWLSSQEHPIVGPFGIYAQRYNAAGVAQGSEFHVNTYTTDAQTDPTVAMDADGDFVVAWTSDGQDLSNTGVYAQRYNAAGVAQGSEFRVNTSTFNFQDNPSVAMDADGDFVVAWEGNGPGGEGQGVFAQRYNAAGVAQGEFQVNTYTTSTQRGAAVAMDADGDFVVAWQSVGQEGGGDYGIYAQYYDAAGVAQGSEFRVNTYTTSSQTGAAVAMDADGDFVVAWSGSGVGDGSGVFAQRYATPATVTEVRTQTGEVISQAVTIDPWISSLTVQFSQNMSTVGGTGGATSVTNPANYQLLQGLVDISSLLGGVTYGFNPSTAHFEATLALTAPLLGGSYQLTVQDSLQSERGQALDGDENGAPSGDFVLALNVASVLRTGPEFRVNTYTTNLQEAAAVATDADGDFVVAWESTGQDGSSDGVYAQRYNAAGVAQGSEFRVNTETFVEQQNPSVAMDADGDFVVAWASNLQEGSNQGIYAQRYNAAGVAQGSEFHVNTYTTGVQREPAVAMDADGDFVVAWESVQDGDSYGVYAQRYNAAGVAQGSEFRVNTYTTSTQALAGVAMDADGDFVAAWYSAGQDGSNTGIYAQRYNAAGVAQGIEFRANTYTTNTQAFASVAMDADGDFVVAWSSRDQDGSNYGIYAQRYNAAGVAQGSEFRVNTYTTNSQSGLTLLAMDADGDFVVAWASDLQDGSNFGIYAQPYNAAGVPQGGEFRVNTYTTSTQFGPAVAMDADGDFVVAWQSFLQDGSSHGIYAQRFSVVRVVPTGSEFRVNTYTTNLQEAAAVATDADGDFVVAWESTGQDGSSDGVYAQRYNAAGVAQGSEFRVNTETFVEQQNPSVAMDADGDFVVAWASNLQEGSNQGIYAQRYNAAGVAQGSEFHVNTYTTGVQREPAVAMDADGDFVVAWESVQDGDSYGVYAQRYNAAGVAQGSEFRVNTYTTSTQALAGVAMDADGDFVAAWYSAGQDGSNTGIYAQRYNAAGVAQGIEFRANTYTTNTQAFASVAMDADGDFVVAWSSRDQDGSNYGIYAQRYNAAGVAQGSEFRVNTYTTNSQSGLTLLAMDADGDFVVAWASDLQDGSNFGIYAQPYNAAGVPQGGEFRVNTYTTSTQFGPAVAMDADGDFVVAWQSFLQDGSSHGIYAQRYINTALATVTNVTFGSVVVEFSRNVSTAGGSAGANSATNPANYQLFQGMTDISGSITGITYAYNLATAHFEATLTVSPPLTGGSYQLIVSDAVLSEHGQPLDGDNDGVPGGDAAEPFEVPPATVAGTKLFYKGSSKWNVTNGATFSDDNAIASDKTAYIPGSGTTTFSAVSSYDKGINGLMVDISGPHGTITASDFIFKVGNNNSPSTWATATGPTTVTTRAGSGAGGSDRIELLWANNAIQKQWLEVVVKGNDALGSSNTNTGLASSYVFIFGNALGDAGAADGAAFSVTSSDEISARNDPHGIGNPATISNVNDYNRDGFVNSSDQIISRNNGTGLGNQLKFLVVGAGGPFAPDSGPATSQAASSTAGGGTSTGSVEAGIASALAASGTRGLSKATSEAPAWPIQRKSVLDLNAVAAYFQHLAGQQKRQGPIVSGLADEVADELSLDECLVDTLWKDF